MGVRRFSGWSRLSPRRFAAFNTIGTGLSSAQAILSAFWFYLASSMRRRSAFMAHR
jgi:membrane protein DedA with SNARE-associated domain